MLLNLLKIYLVLIICGLIASCSLNRARSPEEERHLKENKTKIENEIATPIVLTAASNCIHYFELKSWPDIKNIPKNNSAFESYTVKEANSAATFLKFKLKSNPYYWEMDIHIKDDSIMRCKVDTRGGRSPETMNLQVSYDFAINESKNTEDVISSNNDKNKDFITTSLLLYCGDKCFSNEKINNDWLSIIGPTITTVAMYALLGLAHGGYDY